jgi:hypothetical protein
MCLVDPPSIFSTLAGIDLIDITKLLGLLILVCFKNRYLAEQIKN